jgi:cation diffusion facilitator CzcD-associated flavoprotein CzcO
VVTTPVVAPAPVPAEGTRRTAHLDALIIGAGFSGLCVAHQLARRGFSFRILERAGEVGGTWRDNTYPGCACDIPSPLYSFSFAQRSGWTRLFPPQPEILDYLREFSGRDGLRAHIDFHTEVTGAWWREDDSSWLVRTADGASYTAGCLISAIGALHVPKIPALPGLGGFAGPTMHSATWDHRLDLAGKRVAVIGTGASAIQFVPRLVDQVAALTVFQRTPHWILPKSDRRFSTGQRLARRLSPYRWYVRSRLFWIHESRRRSFTDGAVRSDEPPSQMEQLARAHLRRQVPDAALRAKLTPNYAIGCKRLLISSDFYPALGRPNVHLETSGIREVRPNSIVAADGTEHPCDVIIFGTGFDTQHGLAEIPVVGRDGQLLTERWRDGLEAYLGTTVSGFPNYFVMMGPNSGLGHNSQIFMIEAQARYAISCLTRMRRARLGSIEVKADVERRYNRRLQGLLDGSVWQAGGCTSWYQHPDSGRNTLLWPSSLLDFWRRTRLARLADYRTRR